MSIENCRENHVCMQTYLLLRTWRAVSGFLFGADVLGEARRCLWLTFGVGLTQLCEERPLSVFSTGKRELILFV